MTEKLYDNDNNNKLKDAPIFQKVYAPFTICSNRWKNVLFDPMTYNWYDILKMGLVHKLLYNGCHTNKRFWTDYRLSRFQAYPFVNNKLCSSATQSYAQNIKKNLCQSILQTFVIHALQTTEIPLWYRIMFQTLFPIISIIF